MAASQDELAEAAGDEKQSGVVNDEPEVSRSDAKTSDGGIILIPQPSSDSRDPLNWSVSKKATIVATLFLAMFVGFSAPFCGQLNLQQQAALYGKTTVQITYFNSAASAGLATGGYFWWPLSSKFGRSSVIFWTLFGQLAAQIWAPMMTRPDQYAPYLVSRYFSAFFGVTVSVLGPRYLVDMFFLHQRGRAFTVLHLALNFGASAGPTFAGFVAANAYWPVEYWWSVALTGFTIIIVFLFLEETSYDRSEGAANRILPNSWIRDRFETFFLGTKVAPPTTWSHTLKIAITPFKIAVAPVLLIIAGFDTISFGFYVALNALTPVWLQLPVKAGGIYGFSVTQNAAFTFVHWIGLIVGFAYGHFFSDRIPLWLVARNKEGVWKPEYRLHALWPTNFILMPLGLGLVGCAMQYRLHWFVMALAQFFITIGSLVSIPVTVNYICECFRTHTVEAALVLNSMRLFLGLSINFYINPWIAAVGVGWVYGMMAFFSVFAFMFLIALMIWGHTIRKITPFSTAMSEEGQHVVTKGPEDDRF
ncbi:major facilitator superfamily domain-containing protein [Diplogelasinospora grovesii]|uniref:Major facilitator superfamily domain-containing protein n=1 Tax=Diplogelasinospora grovesii TaxID=303347 RepID=A0AAN6S142_9PEZI|nr:major facilitator superfamily domain-containing protein [Diplogelasinospora grovesii]